MNLIDNGFVFAVFVYQATIEQTQGPSFPLASTAFPFVWYKTPTDDVTCDECVQWHDERTAMSGTLTSAVKCK